MTSSIVWEIKGARTLFGRRGVRGLANVDITSEVAVRIAMAYGTALKKGSVAFQKMQILNFLGSEGWELMEQLGTGATASATA